MFKLEVLKSPKNLNLKSQVNFKWTTSRNPEFHFSAGQFQYWKPKHFARKESCCEKVDSKIPLIIIKKKKKACKNIDTELQNMKQFLMPGSIGYFDLYPSELKSLMLIYILAYAIFLSYSILSLLTTTFQQRLLLNFNNKFVKIL